MITDKLLTLANNLSVSTVGPSYANFGTVFDLLLPQADLAGKTGLVFGHRAELTLSNSLFAQIVTSASPSLSSPTILGEIDLRTKSFFQFNIDKPLQRYVGVMLKRTGTAITGTVRIEVGVAPEAKKSKYPWAYTGMNKPDGEDIPEGITEPSQITEWTFSTASTAYKIDMSVTEPDDGGSAITGYEYSLDGGATVLPLEGVGPWELTMPEASTSYTAIVRARNAIGPALWAEALSAFSGSFTASAPGQFSLSDWAVSTGAADGEIYLSIAAMPANSGSPITAVKYSLTGGAPWTTLSGISTGTRTILAPVAGSVYSIVLAAENSVGLGAASASKSVMSGQTGTTTDVSVVAGESAFSVTVPYGDFSVTVEGTTYNLNTADIIGKAPVILRDATLSGMSTPVAAGDTVSVATAPFIYDAASGIPVVQYYFNRDGLILATGTSYTLTSLDVLAGIVVEQQVINAGGVGSRRTTVSEKPAYTATPLVFSGSQYLRRTGGAGVDPDEVVIAITATNLTNAKLLSGNALFSADTVKGSSRTHSYTSTNSTTGAIQGTMRVENTNGNTLAYNSFVEPTEYPPYDLAVTDKVSWLFSFNKTGAYSQVMTVNGVVKVLRNGAMTPTVTQIDMSHAFTFGAANGRYAKVDLLDGRVFCGTGIWRDFSQIYNRALFINEVGDPTHTLVANAAFGQPKIWIPLNAADANALVNLGTAGAFTSKNGTFA